MKKSISKKFNTGAVIDSVKKPVLVIGGMFIGSMVGKQLDKMLKVDQLDESFNVKKLVRPVALMGAGIAANLLIKNEDIKLVGLGVTGSGLATGVKVFLKKDILNGLAGIGEGEVTQLTIEPYNPDLKELRGAPEARYLSMNNTDAPNDYIEVGEIPNADLI